MTLAIQPIEEMPWKHSVLVVWLDQGTIRHAARLQRDELIGYRLWNPHYTEPDGWMELPEVETL